MAVVKRFVQFFLFFLVGGLPLSGEEVINLPEITLTGEDRLVLLPPFAPPDLFSYRYMPGLGLAGILIPRGEVIPVDYGLLLPVEEAGAPMTFRGGLVYESAGLMGFSLLSQIPGEGWNLFLESVINIEDFAAFSGAAALGDWFFDARGSFISSGGTFDWGFFGGGDYRSGERSLLDLRGEWIQVPGEVLLTARGGMTGLFLAGGAGALGVDFFIETEVPGISWFPVSTVRGAFWNSREQWFPYGLYRGSWPFHLGAGRFILEAGGALGVDQDRFVVYPAGEGLFYPVESLKLFFQYLPVMAPVAEMKDLFLKFSGEDGGLFPVRGVKAGGGFGFFPVPEVEVGGACFYYEGNFWGASGESLSFGHRIFWRMGPKVYWRPAHGVEFSLLYFLGIEEARLDHWVEGSLKGGVRGFQAVLKGAYGTAADPDFSSFKGGGRIEALLSGEFLKKIQFETGINWNFSVNWMFEEYQIVIRLFYNS